MNFFSFIHICSRLLLDNRTLTIVQVLVSAILFVSMFVVWRTQKTYPGFGHWTFSHVIQALGWLLINLQYLLPAWFTTFLGLAMVVASPILIHEGICQFRSKPCRDVVNYSIILLFIGVFVVFTWMAPNTVLRMIFVTLCTILVICRCAFDLLVNAPRQLRSSYWFTGMMFALFGLVLTLRLVNVGSSLHIKSPFDMDIWQTITYLAMIVLPVGWTFGLFMMTNNRLTLELRAVDAELREMATTDFLTGAYNRRSFADTYERETARTRRSGDMLGLLILDIDHFKLFNDSFGHLIGDAMLRVMANACRANLRSMDVLARWGGEEFVVLLPDTDREGCLFVAERLRQAVAETGVPLGEGMAYITVSVGGTLWLPEDPNLDAVLRRADAALYRAKQRGRNCVEM